MSDGKVVFDITGNLSGINSALNDATNTISKQTAKWTVLGQTAMNGLVSAAKAGFDGIKALAKNAFEYNASMETYEVNFRTLLGSAENAQAKMVELKEYAAHTPFAFADLADATQTLLAFQLSSEDASLALKHLGDISLGDANKLQSLTLAFGQVSSAGKLAGQDLLQMINAGFNPLNVIAEKTGAAYADLKAVMSGEKTSEDFQLRMEAARREVEELGVNASESAIMLAQIGKDGMISADMVAAAMRIATSEGGAFYKALESASTTAKGQISTIQDSWNMLTGKMTGGVFDTLSQEAFPKIIQWLDDLNAAFDENGFTGLKTAAGRIFGEIGGMAFDLGAGLVTKIYNGLTGDDKTVEEVKAYLSEIFGAASDAVNNIKGAGVTFLEWVKDNGELIGAAATTIGIGLGVFALLSNPLVGILTALAGALLVFTTDWETFEAKYPNIVKAFEDITGIEFSDFVAGVESAKTHLSTFYNEALVPLFDWLSEHGEALQLALAGIGVALLVSGHPLGGISMLLGVIIGNWNEIKTIVTDVLNLVYSLMEAVGKLAGIKPNDEVIAARETYAEENTAAQAEAARQSSSSKYAGKYAYLDDDVKWELQYYTKKAIEKGTQSGLQNLVNMDIVSPELLQSLQADVADALNSGDFTVEIAETWFEDAESDLQGQLNGMNLSATVNARLAVGSLGAGLNNSFATAAYSLIGQTHASGGIFNAATRFLSADGMHTIGESGTEAILPLDVLWRKMGLIFDQTFAANLDGLQYSVMPQIPAAAPVAYDRDDLGETVAAAVREAISGLTVEMDKRKVGKIVAPEVSKDIANNVNGRRWTA